MENKIAVEKLQNLCQIAKELLNKPSGSQEFKKWNRDTEVAIERIFGGETRHLSDFQGISYSMGMFFSDTPDSAFENAYRDGVRTAITTLQSFIDEINEYWVPEPTVPTNDLGAIQKVELIISKFHSIARQLRSRHADRATIEIEDEYDVQDLFHALLKLYFDDIRPEEYTPSYAGSASRVDFLLKNERMVIEIKKTRASMKAKDVGEQLIIDTQRYKAHPDCNVLVCFVYDPEGRIGNPKGIESDLTKTIDGMPVSVFITPQN